jgi:caffeoyl-CoA O-methyltransferase
MADTTSRTGSSYVTEEILRYLDDLHGPHDAGLDQAFHAPERESIPAIQVGRSEGRFLEWLARLHRVNLAVEVGTLAGYSAIRMARGMAAGSRLHSIEREPRHAAIARANVGAAGLSDRIEVHEGDGMEVLERLSALGPFDLMFVDADKERYDLYGRWAALHLRPGGLLIGDNVYYFGRLLDESPAALAMRRFHTEAKAHFDTCVVPTPDGMLLGIKR